MNCFHTRSIQFLPKFFLLFSFCIWFFNTSHAEADGKKIFTQNCASCHRIDDQKLVGPGLKDIQNKVPQPAHDWLFKWIKNNKEVLKSGDAYATKIFEENNKLPMNIFDGILSDEEINAVINYIETPPAPKQEVAAQTPGGATQPIDNTKTTVIILLYAAVLLIVLIGILTGVRKHLRDMLQARKGLPPVEPVGPMKWVSQNKGLVVIVSLVVSVIIIRAIYIGLMNIGVYETYQPVQPIKYSHETHAGKLQINCVYCHSGAEKGRTASIPSANVCMNCHKAIQEGPKTGKAEIAKIYDAVGWNPETGKYDKPQHPIKWVRVHELPDFAYFNHSQHVVVGKQDCKNCHGDMAKIDEAKQVSPLTMGWCVDCHRKTEVPGMATNPYYAELHEKLKAKYKGEPITVEKMGGLDCIKCHY